MFTKKFSKEIIYVYRLCIVLFQIFYNAYNFAKSLFPFFLIVAWHAVNTHKYAWANVHVYAPWHRRIHRKYSFIRRLICVSCSWINTFHDTEAYRSFIARFVFFPFLVWMYFSFSLSRVYGLFILHLTCVLLRVCIKICRRSCIVYLWEASIPDSTCL